jgi:sec-independent protein translocase protein TatA
MTIEPILALGIPGPGELALILGICILLFGARKLPQLAKGVGQSLLEFKKAVREGRAIEEDLGELKEDVKKELTP